jgi:multidrug efflux pump subunit AcrB
MSLGGLALGIGMLVDNSIVVLEAIDRRRNEGFERRRAAITGAGEVAGAVTAATLTTVAVFFPIVFVQGVAGQLFRDQAITVCLSLASRPFRATPPAQVSRALRASPAAARAREKPCPSPSALQGSSSNR